MRAARSFLATNDPKSDGWLGKAQQMRLAYYFMGLASLYLLEDHDAIAGLEPAMFVTWAPVVADTLCVGDRRRLKAETVRRFVETAPTELATTWVKMYEGESGLLPLVAFQEGWTPEVGAAFLRSLKAQTDPIRIAEILTQLLAKGVEESHEYARVHLHLLDSKSEDKRPSDNASPRRRCSQGPRGTSLRSSRNSRVSLKMPALRCSIWAAGASGRLLCPAEGWTGSNLGRLTELLQRHFPASTDRHHNGAHWIDPEESLRMLRERCLSALGRPSRRG